LSVSDERSLSSRDSSTLLTKHPLHGQSHDVAGSHDGNSRTYDERVDLLRTAASRTPLADPAPPQDARPAPLFPGAPVELDD